MTQPILRGAPRLQLEVTDLEEFYFERLEKHLNQITSLKKPGTFSKLLEINFPLTKKDKEYVQTTTKEQGTIIQAAVKELSGLLQVIGRISDKKRIYTHLFCLFPFIDKENLKLFLRQNNSTKVSTKEGPFQELLNYTPQLQEEQKKLALLLALLHLQEVQEFSEDDPLELDLKFKKYQEAMNYWSQANKINQRLNGTDRGCAYVFSELIHQISKECFQIRLKKTKNDELYFKEVFEQIEKKEKLCFMEEHQTFLADLYTLVIESIPKFGFDLQKKYENYMGDAFKLRKRYESCEINPHTFPLKYSIKLQEYRELFKYFIFPNDDILLVRSSQTEFTRKLRELFQSILEDAFLIVGPPPCSCDISGMLKDGYDIRPMGSVGREEPCPFSDIELMILFKEEGHEEYFKTLTEVLNFLIISVGETSNIPLIFTSLYSKNPSGFHLDVSPACDSNFMGTPNKVAQLQNLQKEQLGPQTAGQMVRKSLSFTNNPSLYESYLNEMSPILDHPEYRRHSLALELFRQRMHDYYEAWKVLNFQYFDIKKQCINLFHVISDIGFYWGIEKTNTLDILVALTEKGVFTQESGQLLQEVFASIYQIRSRLHLSYGEQNDEAFSSQSVQARAFSHRGILRENERQQLERCYWLVLLPLYRSLETVMQGKNFADVFKNLDLVGVAFDEVINASQNLEMFKPALFYLVTHTIRFDNSHDILLKNYQKLSENVDAYPLRVTYLQALEQHLLKEYKSLEKFLSEQEFIERLAAIPDQKGLRLSMLRNQEKLQATIRAITTSEPEKAGNITCVRITSPFLPASYLKAEVINEILDNEGNIRDAYKGSLHPVEKTKYGLHFKQKPIQALMEYSIYNLFFRIAGPLAPATVLTQFEVTINGKTKVFPVLISETIPGVTLKEKAPPAQLDAEGWKRWTWMILCTLLSKHGDGLPSNYILKGHQIYCIDNDISFVISFIKAFVFLKQVNFCSAIFFLYPDQPLDSEVLEQFCHLNVDEILNAWIQDVINKEKEYLALFSPEDRKRWFEDPDPKKRFSATALFHEGAMMTLKLQFHRLQNYLLLKHKKEITALELLEQLVLFCDFSLEIEVGAYVSQAYREVLSKPYLSLQEKTLEVRRQRGSSLSLSEAHKACLNQAPSFEEVEKLKRWTPKEAQQELFVTLLKRSSLYLSVRNTGKQKVIQANFKGLLQDSSEQSVATPPLRESQQRIILRALIALVQMEPEKPTTVILQHCSVLNSTTLEPFLHDKLEYLDLRFCSQIQDKDIEMIQQKCPHLKELYLSGCSQIKQFALSGTFSSSLLEFLDLEYLSIEQCPNLAALQLRAPMLKELKANKNPNLSLVEVPFEWEWIPMEFDECPKVNFSYLTLQGHSNPVMALTALAGGVLASGSEDATIRLWDTSTGKCLRTLEGHSGRIYALTALAEGVLASGCKDNTIVLWDIATGKCLRILKGHAGRVYALTALAGGVLASASDDNTIRLWDTATGKCLRTLGGHWGQFYALTALAGGALASGCKDNSIVLWDTATGKCLRILKGHLHHVYVLTSFAGGVLASGSYDNSIMLWDTATGKCLHTLKGHSSSVIALTALAEGVLASGSYDDTIKLWDTATGKCLRTLRGHASRVYALTTLPGGILASASDDKTIKLWKFNRVPKMRCIATLSSHPDAVNTITTLEGGILASGSTDWTIKLLDTVTGKCLRSLKEHSSWVRALTALTGGVLASGSFDKTIKLWDTTTGKCLRTLEGHSGWVMALTALGGGVLASGSQDNTIKLWDTTTGKCLRTLEGHSSWVKALTALAGGVLASGSLDTTIKLWDTATGKCLRTLEGHSREVGVLTTLIGGVLASGSQDDTIKLWDTATGKCLRTLEGHSSWVFALTALAGGVLASGSLDTTIKLWDMATGKCLRTLEGHSRGVNTLTTFEGRVLVSGSDDKTIKLWK